jgi:hypothetical protein
MVNEHLNPLHRQAGRGVVHVGYHLLESGNRLGQAQVKHKNPPREDGTSRAE